MLAGVAVMGRVIHWMARNYPQRPSLAHCMVFAGYVATPLFLSGIVALYPLVWLCALIGTVALFLYRLSAVCRGANLPQYQ